MGYHKDASAAVVFQATNQLREVCEGRDVRRRLLWMIEGDNVMKDCSLDKLRGTTEGSDQWKQSVRYISVSTTNNCAIPA